MDKTKTVLQVPMPLSWRRDAEKVALQDGFTSLQDVVRVLIRQYASRLFTISPVERELSPTAEQRYIKMQEDIRRGRVKTRLFTSVDALMKHLNA